MSPNEGVLGNFHFGGEHAHTPDHPPVLLCGPVKAGTIDMPAGMLLAVEASGDLTPYAGTGVLAGVCDEPYTAGEATCTYLAHGTVKARLLVKTGGAVLAAADVQSLNKMGVFAL